MEKDMDTEYGLIQKVKNILVITNSTNVTEMVFGHYLQDKNMKVNLKMESEMVMENINILQEKNTEGTIKMVKNMVNVFLFHQTVINLLKSIIKAKERKFIQKLKRVKTEFIMSKTMER